MGCCRGSSRRPRGGLAAGAAGVRWQQCCGPAYEHNNTQEPRVVVRATSSGGSNRTLPGAVGRGWERPQRAPVVAQPPGTMLPTLTPSLCPLLPACDCAQLVFYALYSVHAATRYAAMFETFIWLWGRVCQTAGQLVIVRPASDVCSTHRQHLC
jgi:hypothetical protein